jgi:hypothetical protein
VQVIGEVKPLAQIPLGSRHRPLRDRFDLLGISANAILSKRKSQERDFLGTEYALVDVCIQTVLPYAHQNIPEVCEVHVGVGLPILSATVNEDIVEVGLHKVPKRPE